MVLIDSWPYDLIVAGDVSFASEVTNHATERGSNISDHVRAQPAVLNLEVIVSNSPIGEIAAHESRRVLEDVEIFGANQVPLPSAEAYERLTAIRDEGRLVTVEIPVAARGLPGKPAKPGKRTYRSMAITNLSERFGADTAGGMYFSVSFKQVRLVDNRRVVVRTATPAGKGKTTNKAVGKTYIVEARVSWQFARSAFPDWAVVEIERERSSGKVVYRYTGDAASTFPYKATKGRQLPPNEATAFEAFLKEQKAARANEQTREIQTRGGKTNLPAGMDLNRVQEPAPPQQTPKPAVKSFSGRSVGRKF